MNPDHYLDEIIPGMASEDKFWARKIHNNWYFSKLFPHSPMQYVFSVFGSIKSVHTLITHVKVPLFYVRKFFVF
jgi:hypothetical protein